MRKIYIIRHCKPMQSAMGKCISQLDLPLSAVGLEQAEVLKEWVEDKQIINIYTSPLRRCVETTSFVARGEKINVLSELTEISVGEWEGLSFSEIKERWSKEYELRGLHMGTTAPPSGESFAEGGERFDRVIRRIMEESVGDVLIVSHSGVLRGWLCKIAKISPDRVFEFDVPHGSITEVNWDEADFCIQKVGEKLISVPERKETQAFYKECNTPVEVQQHCIAVARKAMELANGLEIDKKMLYVASLLHDMCKKEGKEHPQKAAKRLKKAGYGKLAQIVAVHHDLPKDMTELEQHQISQEAEILYLSDKLVCETKTVTLEERFEASYGKCTDEAAIVAWQKRYGDAKRILEKYS